MNLELEKILKITEDLIWVVNQIAHEVVCDNVYTKIWLHVYEFPCNVVRG